MIFWPVTIFRTCLAVLATFAGWFGMLLGQLLFRFAPRTSLKVRGLAFRAWAKTLLWCFRVRVELSGTQPPAGAFLISNHVSYLDIMVLSSVFDAAFVAKADIRGWPMLGTIFAAADTLYLDRARKRDLLRIMDEMDAKLAKGLGLVVFPEGTSSKGEDILPLRPSLLQYAIQRKLPVYWATLVYRTQEDELVPSRGVCWWGSESLPPHYLRLMTLTRVDVRLHFSATPIEGEDRKKLADDLRLAMLKDFTPMP